jgi:outer membrane lipase/esterase
MTAKVIVGAAVTLSLAASQAAASTYDALFAFGDSTVDSGWWSGALLGQCDGVATPCTTGNNTKDGLISSAIAAGGSPPANGAPVGAGNMNNVQDLAAKFGLTANPANQPGGTDYAISGALSAPAPNLPPNPPSPPLGNLNPNTNLPSTMTQIANYLSAHSGVADGSALYVISSGGNDVTYATDNIAAGSREAFLRTQASALAGEIATLQTDGAKSIVVYGLQGSGMLPTFMTSTLFTDLKNDNVNFLGIDIAGLIAAVQANPGAYDPNLTTTSIGVVGPSTGSACVSQTGATSPTGWGQWCANSTTQSSLHAYLRTADAEQTSLFSDDQHLSAAGQQIEANFVFDEINTPVPAALPLFATGLGALGLLGWRRKRKARASLLGAA